jgi:Phytanoyl-CoA dioxygenase (PhyH)
MTVELTKDYATAERDLREHGYCLLESVLPAAQLTGLRDRVAELAEQERRDSTAYVYDKDSQRIFSLHAKGGVPRHHRAPDHAADGEHPRVQLPTSQLAREHRRPGGERMDLHADQTFAPPP